MLKRLVTVLSTLLILAGCSTTSPSHKTGIGSLDTGPLRSVEVTAVKRESVAPHIIRYYRAPADLWVRIRRELSWHDDWLARSHDLDGDPVERARKGILRQPRYLPVVAKRAELYLHYIVNEVDKRGLPMELALVPLVESMLNPFAASPSRAAGLWQIMPRTGRALALDQNWWYDGRRDVRTSTRAALDYLESLNKRFDGDWMLTLAAYNAGKGRVGKAQRRNKRQGKPTDYWSLRLPNETRAYVPKIIALTQIIADPYRYGAELAPVANKPAFEVASTGGQLELFRAAKLAGIELKALRALNPGQLRWATAPDQPAEILLPTGTARQFESSLAALPKAERVAWQHYRIENGDSLIRIARQFDTKVQLLREVNGIRGSRIRAGDTLLIPHGKDWEQSLQLSASSNRKQQGYRVRRGDSLSRIAGKFKVSIREIIAWNALDPGKYLQPGQTLKLYVAGG
ncbi:MAG: transglycosylase SLT domain-containing protein [Halioglobus sp.]